MTRSQNQIKELPKTVNIMECGDNRAARYPNMTLQPTLSRDLLILRRYR